MRLRIVQYDSPPLDPDGLAITGSVATPRVFSQDLGFFDST